MLFRYAPLVNLSVRMAEILTRLYAAFDTGDATVWSESLAPDVVLIGTDETEWWVGKEVALPVLRAQAAEMHGAGIRVTDSDPQIGSNGNTVWAADHPMMTLPDGSQVPLRLTMVAALDEDSLLIRQGHLSVGAPNEEVVHQTLTV
jgi:hypothetical protein